jgi:lipid-A-disaccharide synthase-like uncharacterized protein
MVCTLGWAVAIVNLVPRADNPSEKFTTLGDLTATLGLSQSHTFVVTYLSTCKTQLNLQTVPWLFWYACIMQGTMGLPWCWRNEGKGLGESITTDFFFTVFISLFTASANHIHKSTCEITTVSLFTCKFPCSRVSKWRFLSWTYFLTICCHSSEDIGNRCEEAVTPLHLLPSRLSPWWTCGKELSVSLQCLIIILYLFPFGFSTL